MSKYSHNKEITKTWDIMQHDVSITWPGGSNQKDGTICDSDA
jgi:hypothetical protein